MSSPADDLRALLAEQFDDGDGGWLKEHAAAVLALLDAAQAHLDYHQTCIPPGEPRSVALAAAVAALTEPRP